MKNQILEAISYIKNVNKKSPTAKKFLKTSTFKNLRPRRQILPKLKLMIISKLLRNPKTEILFNPLMKHIH